MTLPRLNYLSWSEEFLSYELVSKPVDLAPVLGGSMPLVESRDLGNGSLVAAFGRDVLDSNAIYINLTITNASSLQTSGSINVTLSASSTGESISLGQIPLSSVGSDFFMSRQNLLGFGQENPFFTGAFSTPVVIKDGEGGEEASYSMEMVFDRSLVEVYLQGGRKVGTMSVFPVGEMDTVVVRSRGVGEGVVVGVEVWGLEGTWGV